MSLLDRPYRLPPGSDRLVVAISDIEMGAGGAEDDFPHTEFLADRISFYGTEFDLDIDLVFNGDTFDFLRVDVDGQFHRHITAEIAEAKLKRVAAAHHTFFDAVAAFLGSTRRQRRVHFVIGNHDSEIIFPSIQDDIRSRCGASDQIFFPGFGLGIGELHIEHGSQGDTMFRMDPDDLYVGAGGEVLNLSWGTLALLEALIPLYPALYYLDRVKPRDRLFELLPELKELLLDRSWQYWTRDYLREWFRKSDPMKRVSWSMIKEIVYRFTSVNTESLIQDYYSKGLMRDHAHKVYVVGHAHRAGWWSWGDKKLLQTGCFRDEFMLQGHGSKQAAIAKSYAEVFMEGDKVRRSHLVEIDGPPAPTTSIYDFQPALLELLGSREQRQRAMQAQADHEAHEKNERRR